MNNGFCRLPPSRASLLNGPVADSFNPYRDWLGLANEQRPATHYGLFGLKPLESDAAKIRKAMAQLAAKLRGIHPGDHTREWQKIIKELSLAKACLTDPAAKAAYDAQLRASGEASEAVSRDVPMTEPPASPQTKKEATPATKGKPRTPAKPQRTIKDPQAPSSAKASPPAATPPGGAAGKTSAFQGVLPPIPTAPPTGFNLPPIPGAPTGHAPPQEYPGYLPPIPGVPPVGTGLPPADTAQDDYGEPEESEDYPPPVPSVSPDYTAFPPGDDEPIDYPDPEIAAYRPAANVPSASDHDTNQFVIPADVFWDPNVEETPERTWTLAGVMIACLIFLVVVLGSLTGFVLYQRHTANLALARARQAKPVEVAKPAPEAPRPTAPDPAKLAEELARKKASLQKNLTELVAALAKRDLAAAQGLVAQARANAQSPDEQAIVAKYAKLGDDVREFWQIIGGRVSKFQPSEEVALGKTRIIVVGVRDGRFSFRYGSKIFSYTLESLPTWLVVALADGNLPDDGPSKELYGAFLAVDPEGDRPRAQTLWAEAAKLGLKVDQLLPALDTLPTPPGP